MLQVERSQQSVPQSLQPIHSLISLGIQWHSIRYPQTIHWLVWMKYFGWNILGSVEVRKGYSHIGFPSANQCIAFYFNLFVQPLGTMKWLPQQQMWRDEEQLLEKRVRCTLKATFNNLRKLMILTCRGCPLIVNIEIKFSSKSVWLLDTEVYSSGRKVLPLLS